MSDGQEFEGRSFREVVAHMAGAKLRRPRTLERYRRDVASRVGEMYDITIDTSSDARFIRSLIEHKLMEHM